MSKPKILFLAHLLPWPLEGGGQIKSYHVLKILSQRYDVTMLALVRSEAESANVAPLAPLCAGGARVARLARGKSRDAAIAAKTLMARKSFLVERDQVEEMQTLVAAELASGDYSAIHVDHLQMARYVPSDTKGARVVLDQHNVEHRIPKRIAESPGVGPKSLTMRAFAGLEWKRMREFERDAVLRADLTLAVSDEDREILQGLVGANSGKIITIPIGVDTEHFGEVNWQPGNASLVSIGTMYWPPNVDAALYFYGDIFPKIKRERPDATLCVVGARPTPEIVALGKDESVTVTGLVPDTRPYAENCGVFIVPLRSGSGMRVKILNALAMGVPIVSTTVGAEGIDVKDGENILLADTPDEFSSAVLRLLADPDLARRLGENGKALVRENYGWDAIGERLLRAYAEALA